MKCRKGLTVCLLFAISASASAQTTLPSAKRAEEQPKAFQFPFLEYLQYRFFANAIFDRFQQGDIATAARVAHIMEISWDRDSDRFTVTDQTKGIWKRLDAAQDEFIQPIMGGVPGHGTPRPPDPLRVESAYRQYLSTLAREASISDAQAAKLSNEQ
jgi:hypothetical protein